MTNHLLRNGLQNYFPDPQHLGEWQENTDFVMNDPLPPHLVRAKPFSCSEKRLFPTHPSQGTKEYLHAVYSMYDHGRLPPNSYACLIRNPTGKFCVRAATAMIVVMSDTYTDNCGNLYRGYWLVTYLKSDESMGTLYAKGRTAYPKPDSEFENDFIEGSTYVVSQDDFMILAELLPDDKLKIEAEKARALRSGFRLEGKLFIR